MTRRGPSAEDGGDLKSVDNAIIIAALWPRTSAARGLPSGERPRSGNVARLLAPTDDESSRSEDGGDHTAWRRSGTTLSPEARWFVVAEMQILVDVTGKCRIVSTLATER
jgi:hypothetical protein